MEIMIETEEVLVIGKSGACVRARCERCGGELTLMLPQSIVQTPDQQHVDDKRAVEEKKA